jgi:hypothetical protein
VAAFDSNLCGYVRNCISQPGGTKVDSLADRLMFRLQYRNFSNGQSLVTNHTVDVGSDHAGVRWYEPRNTGSGWSINQQGTYAPDSDHRWMGSVAMNGAGDIGLGYSVASTTTYPSIRFTGRLNSDTLGQMTQGEGTIVNGSGSQSHSSGRWGDYSTMSVDPVDDCTFWYTQEYYSANSSAGWKTRIGSFKLVDCDSDGDGVPDSSDNCPALPKAGQENNDGDVEGDVCDDDDDNDGLTDVEEGNYDGVPGYNPGTDPNPFDPDTDDDGYLDGVDPVPLHYNYADGNVAPWGAIDTDVNAADLLVCLQFVLGLKVPTNEDLAHGDLYPIGAPDGEIGLPDYIQLQKLVMF